MEKTKNLLTFVDGPKESSKEKKKGGGGGGRVSVAQHRTLEYLKCTVCPGRPD